MSDTPRKIACTFCKKRKIKCDKKEPCGGCTKYNNPLCVYVSPKKRTPKNKEIESELDSLKNKILRLEEALTKVDNTLKESPRNNSVSLVPSAATTSSTVTVPSTVLGSQQVQQAPQFLYSPGTLPFPIQLPGPFTLPPQAPNPPTLPPTISNLFGATPNAFESYKPPELLAQSYAYNQRFPQDLIPQYNNKTILSTSGSDIITSDSPSVSSDLTSANVSISGKRENFDEQLLYLKKTATIDDELFHLFNGRQFLFNPHKSFPVEAFQKNCDGLLYFGLFGWNAYFKLDPALFLMWSYLDEKVSDKEIQPLCLKERNNIPNGNSNDNFEGSHLTIGESIRDTAKALGLSVLSNYNDSLSLIAKIEMSLPNRKVIWKLVDIFFGNVFYRAPFTNMDEFRNDISKIIGSEVNENKPIINISDDVDFATLGILLVVLRIAYLSLFSDNSEENEKAFKSNDPDPKAQEKKYLLNHAINVESFFFAQECLNKFNLFNVNDIKILQLLLYIYIYRSSGPEFGVELESNENYNILGLLILTAVSLGLHRDPDYIADGATHKEKELRRNIWYYLRVVDIFQGYTIGFPLRASYIPSDAKDPNIQLNNLVSESVYELSEIPKSRALQDNGCKLLSPACLDTIESFLMMILDVRKGNDVAEIMKQHSVLEHIYKIIHTEVVLDVFDSKSDVEYADMVKYKMFLLTQGSSVSVIFHLFCYFDKLGETELSFYFLRKIIRDYLPAIAEFSSLVFKNNKYLSIIIQAAGSLFHKCLLVVMGLLVRIRVFLNVNTLDAEDTNLFNVFINTLEEYCNNTLLYVNKFADRYYYNWFIGRSTEYAFKVLEPSIQMNSSKFTKIRNDINMGILKSTQKISELNCIVAGINSELRSSSALDQNRFLNDNIDNLWLYLNSMNKGDNPNNVSLIDAILRDLDNITP